MTKQMSLLFRYGVGYIASIWRTVAPYDSNNIATSYNLYNRAYQICVTATAS